MKSRSGQARRNRLFYSLPAILALAVAGCGPATLSNTQTYKPPPTLALVVLVDPASDKYAQELQELASVVRAEASPGEAIVVLTVQPSFGQVYLVRQGDNLSSIAAAHGLTLGDLEKSNAQLGPVAGRNWTWIHPGDRVIIPNGAGQEPLLFVSRAPAGPPPPELVRLPQEPTNPTDYQRAQYNHTVASDNPTNQGRIDAWRAAAATSLQPWQQQVAAELDRKASSPAPPYHVIDGHALASSISAGVATLGGLPGRRLLLLLGGGEHGAVALDPGSFANVNLVVANLADPTAATSWTASGTKAGAASVTTLDTALTQLQLAQAVNR